MVSMLVGRAVADGDAAATADQLFNAARELAAANRWAEACPKFEASLRSDRALGTELNLATCYEHIGKLARAWALYRESIDLAAKAGDAKRRDYAQSHAAALEPRLARVSIAPPGASPAGLVVRWDGAAIEAGALRVGLYADPGRHELSASAPGLGAVANSVTLVAGRTAAIAIPDLAAAQAGGAGAAAPVARESVEPADLVVAPFQPSGVAGQQSGVAGEPSGVAGEASEAAGANVPVAAPSSTRSYVAIGLGGAGLVSAGIGLVFGARASAKFSDAKAVCGAALVCDSNADYIRGQRLVHDARSSATVSTVLVATGGAALIAATVAYLTRQSAQEQRAARIVPMADPRGAGLAVAGRF
jgi:hypothetical protein